MTIIDTSIMFKVWLTLSMTHIRSMTLPTSTWCSPERLPCMVASGTTICRFTKCETKPLLLDICKKLYIIKLCTQSKILRCFLSRKTRGSENTRNSFVRRKLSLFVSFEINLFLTDVCGSLGFPKTLLWVRWLLSM